VIAAGSRSGRRAIAALVLAPVCCSCTSRSLQGALVPTAESAEGASRVPILVATTRQRSDPLEQLLDAIALSPNVKEVTVLCRSMGCSLTLDALRSRSMGAGRIGAKVRNVLLVARNVDINVFREQMQQMGSARPRFALFLSQDDHALKISRSLWGGATRLGDINPDEEPYESDLEREKVLAFDVTHLEGNSHSRAFDDVTSVMGMIERRLAAGQQLAEDAPGTGVVSQ
jgi:esterase/lipase superfamily enzyme